MIMQLFPFLEEVLSPTINLLNETLFQVIEIFSCKQNKK